MKTFFSIAALMLFCILANAQTIPFQGIARDTSGILIPNQAMGVRISIHDSTSTDTVVYKETQSVTTNNLGLFTLNIGSGTVVTGTFTSINWGSGHKFVQLEVDPTGGTSYLNLVTTQLNSVPYALYAANSSNGSFKTPAPSCIPYGGSNIMVADSNFTRDSVTQRTHIIYAAHLRQIIYLL